MRFKGLHVFLFTALSRYIAHRYNVCELSLSYVRTSMYIFLVSTEKSAYLLFVMYYMYK